MNFYILSNIHVPQEVVRYITSVFFDLSQEWIKFKNIYLNAKINLKEMTLEIKVH